jgi:hypothetical protein
MDHLTEPRVDRRSGSDRRADPGTPNRRADDHEPVAEQPARWPLIVGPTFGTSRSRDPWVGVVQVSMADYRAGHLDEVRRSWDDRIVWQVAGSAPWIRPDLIPGATGSSGSGPFPGVHGPDGVFAYHRALEELTGGTFRQALVSLEGSGGPIVEAHVRTTASRGSRTLDVPTLLVFELGALRIRQVTEIPGDQAAWDRFWA